MAYKRRHPGVPYPGAKRARFAPSWMLTKKERERWWKLYRSFGGTRQRGKAYHAAPGARGWAAAWAWRMLKNEGARTLLGVYGNSPHEILRDTGLLLTTLSPGAPAVTAPRSPPRIRNQVFRLGRGSVIVGTNRKWAGTHHRGVPGRLPQRRLWPAPANWPSSWWDSILRQAQEGIVEIAVFLVQRGQP